MVPLFIGFDVRSACGSELTTKLASYRQLLQAPSRSIITCDMLVRPQPERFRTGVFFRHPAMSSSNLFPIERSYFDEASASLLSGEEMFAYSVDLASWSYIRESIISHEAQSTLPDQAARHTHCHWRSSLRCTAL